MAKLPQKDIKKIRQLRASFPREIMVRVRRSQDGGFCAEILSYQGCFTEADTFSELIEMINDALYTYFEVPRKFISYMPSFLPPVQMAQKLIGFPVQRKQGKLKFTANRETVNH